MSKFRLNKPAEEISAILARDIHEDNPQCIMSFDELRKVFLAFFKYNKEFHEDDLFILTNWVSQSIVTKTMLELALEGLVELHIKDGEIAYKVSDDGKDYLRKKYGTKI